MSEVERIIFAVARPEHMAVLFIILSVVYFWLGKHHRRKRAQKCILSFNFALIAGVYLYDAITHPLAADVRIWYRLALLVLAVGFVGYNGDHILDIGEWLMTKMKPGPDE